MPIKLPRFERTVPLVEGDKPSYPFHLWWQKVTEQIESAFLDVEEAQAELAEQLALIQQAQADADAAQADADAAGMELARINSYVIPTSLLSAVDAGTDATITIANHDRIYPVQGTIDVADLAVTGATITGLAYETKYYIYYDDVTLADGTPTYLYTTSSATAQVGTATGRHFVGSITTPAAGGGGTSGGGGTPPGGGGGDIAY